MQRFEIHTPESAPAPAGQILTDMRRTLGFVPNVFAVMAEAPEALRAFAEITQSFGNSSFSPTEREIVQIAASAVNGCAYCVAGHTAFAKLQKAPDDVIAAVRCGRPTGDPKLDALQDFTRALVSQRGHVDAADMERFLAAGYRPAQVFDVIHGIAVKSFSNLTSNLLGLPLDDPFVPYAWETPSAPQALAA